MSFTRARALRSLQQVARVRPTTARLARSQLVTRRYASSEGGHGHGEASSDVPWAIGAVAVSVGGAYFLWPSSSAHADSGHHGAHDEHAEEAEEGEEKEEGEGEVEEKAEGAGEEKSDDSEDKSEESKDTSDKTQAKGESDDSRVHNADAEGDSKKPTESDEDGDGEVKKPSGSQGESQPQGPDANKKSSKVEESTEPETKKGPSNVEGVRGKGMMKEDAPGMSHTVKREPDGKGMYKKRIDSGAQKELGPSDTYREDGSEAAGTSKPGFSPADTEKQGEISSKQSGVSNTPTRHSTAIHEDPEKSKKGEGTPDTAKTMGTVDPNRPQV